VPLISNGCCSGNRAFRAWSDREAPGSPARTGRGTGSRCDTRARCNTEPRRGVAVREAEVGEVASQAQAGGNADRCTTSRRISVCASSEPPRQAGATVTGDEQMNPKSRVASNLLRETGDLTREFRNATIHIEPTPRRVRSVFAGVTVADSRSAIVLRSVGSRRGTPVYYSRRRTYASTSSERLK
jgi:hypothetical protein